MPKGGKRANAGRKKGYPNTAPKVSKPLREQITDIVQRLLGDAPDLIARLNPDQKMSYLIRLLPFICAPAQPDADAPAQQEAAASAIAEKVYQKMTEQRREQSETSESAYLS